MAGLPATRPEPGEYISLEIDGTLPDWWNIRIPVFVYIHMAGRTAVLAGLTIFAT
jgi:hypothetical protein